MSDQQIIVLTIGPVQSYISQARRTQDLFQGSAILSYLASPGVQYAQDQASATVIYPYVEANQRDNIPNRLLILWEGDAEGAQACAQAMESAIRKLFRQLSYDVQTHFMQGIPDEHAQHVVRSIWQAQENTWLECYWVVLPHDQENYGDSVNNANNQMGARKLMRPFPHINEVGRKDSITGEHAVLHDGVDDVQFWQARRDEQRNRALLGTSERLSAISTIKRFAHEVTSEDNALNISRLPSTSSIAAVSFKYDVLQKLTSSPALVEALITFIEALEAVFEQPQDLYFSQRGKYNPEQFPLIDEAIDLEELDTSLQELVQKFRSIDGDFLFEDTLISKTIEEYSQRVPEAQAMRALQKARDGFVRVARQLNIPPPHPYLAILSMDGDSMGKTLSKLTNPQQHSQFSATLADFARKDVQRIVEQEHLGRLVYAGGDDVLALVSVRHALRVSEILRRAFQEKVEAIGIKNHEGEAVTASTGIAFVHHTHDLQSAVQAANNAQKDIAKAYYGRNAIGVQFLRRSGEQRTMGSKWNIGSGEAIIERLHVMIEAFANGTLGRSLPQDIARIHYQMDSRLNLVPQEAREAELIRVLRRRLNKVEGADMQKVEKDVAAVLLWLLQSTPQLSEVQRWVELARFIAQKEGDR